MSGIKVNLEVDSGAVLSFMSSIREHKKYFSNKEIINCSYCLVTVTGEPIGVVGKMSVEVSGANGKKMLDLIITKSNHEYVPLLGRLWLDKLYPEWRKNIINEGLGVNMVCHSPNAVIVSKINGDSPYVLNDSADQSIAQYEAELVLKVDATPIFHTPYSVPFKLRETVKAEIDKLITSGKLIPIKHSDWATPIIAIPKSDGKIRICMDCKVTINRMIQTEHYPIPKIEDIFANLSEARIFCVINLKGAYQQIVVAEKSQKLLTINTIFGLYQYTRLPFSASPAPSIFQQKNGPNNIGN